MIRALVLALFACGCAEEQDAGALTIFAASSLTDAMGELERGFEREHEGAGVEASFAGSQVLRLQIEQGAPADVFVSADEAHMQALLDAGHVVESAVLAHNELVVIVPRDDPAIRSFSDLPRASRVVIGDESVPVGRYARALLARTAFEREVLARVVSEESNVRLVRTKVELGEADAAIVYRTDAIASDRVRIVEIPGALNVRAGYHAGVVAASPRQALAREWIAHARGEEGQRALAAHGFAPHR